MLKGIEFLRKNSRVFKISSHTLSSLRVKRSNDDRQGEVGRSMIEMLGVLAIIAVLSVGGIAGYSKAMEKFKLNKLISEYSEFLYNIVEHEEELHRLAHNTEQYSQTITSTIQAMNLIPGTWKTIHSYMYDSFENPIVVTAAPKDNGGSPDRISIEIYLGGLHSGGIAENFSVKLCTSFFTDILIPLKDSIYNAHIYRHKANFTPSWYGTASCSVKRNCLSNMTLSDVHNLCSMCDAKNDACNINFNL